MAKNPHFRVLALTATPSSDKDKIQPIVDALHISHIEIRSEASPDIVPYIKKKVQRLRDGGKRVHLRTIGTNQACHRDPARPREAEGWFGQGHVGAYALKVLHRSCC